MSNPYEMADMLNCMKPGQCITLDRQVIADLRGASHLLIDGRTG